MVDVIEAAGPAARLWRNVYRKAAEAAEARLQQLLSEHVYHLHGRRALIFIVDGGGEALVAGPGPDVEAPWAYVLEGWSLYADAAGTVTIDLRTAASFAAYPTMASICGGDKPALSSAQKAQSTDVSAWTTALPRGTILRPVVEASPAPATLTRASLTLYVRAV